MPRSIAPTPTARDLVADEAEALALPPKQTPYKRFFGPNLCVRVTPRSPRFPRGHRVLYGRFWIGSGKKRKECRYHFGVLGSVVNGRTITLALGEAELPKIQADADHGDDPRVERRKIAAATGNRFAAAAADW